MYKKIPKDFTFQALETEVLEKWDKEDIFDLTLQKNVDAKDDSNEFVFFDGPPFANGLPHYGHLLTGYVKDTFARYHTMQGKVVKRQLGWDCHGLPAELYVEKLLDLSGKKSIIEYGVKNFNEACRKSVMNYEHQWHKYIKKQGRWVDFNSYKTMDNNYMESVMWAFKNLYDKGLIYEDFKVTPYSWACETQLSNFETKLDNCYRERVDKAVSALFPLVTDLKISELQDCSGIYLMAWTTTPWTLFSNLAIAVNKNLSYIVVYANKKAIILLAERLAHYHDDIVAFLGDEEYTTLAIPGEKLVGIKYAPIFKYYQGHENAFSTLHADFVSNDRGTGLVHIAPAFGEDDYELCKKYQIQPVCPVDESGNFTDEITEFAGRNVFESNSDIIKELKNLGLWIKTEQYKHDYPHCWRTDKPLIYRMTSSWYVEVTKIKKQLLEVNEHINWIPSVFKHSSFGKWLENAKDWAISRNRVWGCPIPVWKSTSKQYPRIDVYGSIAELERDFNCKIHDLHSHNLDLLERVNPDDPTGLSKMKRVDGILDCWFESGSMPFAHVHYPFENKDWFEKHFSAGFVVEYSSQMRGWFYVTLVLHVALHLEHIAKLPPFQNVICHGVILDVEGKKLSKRLNNYPDPLLIFDQYSSDALRWLMLDSNVMNGGELLLDVEGKMVRDVIRLVINPIWNAYSFFITYANLDQIKATNVITDLDVTDITDIYILSKLNIAVQRVKTYMDEFKTSLACKEVELFLDTLNNWYIRRSREKFWAKEITLSKINAYNTLYTVLNNICLLTAPLLPFLTEYIYSNINNNFSGNSVHLQPYPKLIPSNKDQTIVTTTEVVRALCSSALSIRSAQNVKIRQPLKKLIIVSNQYCFSGDFIEIIKDELNVKEIVSDNNLSNYVDYKVNINFSQLAKRCPDKIKDILSSMKAKDYILSNNNSELSIAGEKIESEEFFVSLVPKDDNNFAVVNHIDNLVVGLDMNITAELKEECIARDFVRLIQSIRKDLDLNLSEKINLHLYIDNVAIKNALIKFEDFDKYSIKNHILLSDSFVFLDKKMDEEEFSSHNLENETIQIKVVRVEIKK